MSLFLRRLAILVAVWLLAAALSADPLISLAVVPFGNLSSYSGHLLERRVAAALAAEARAPWAPVDPVLVQRTLEEMSAPSPPGTGEIQALCRRLPASLALHGALSSAQVDATSARVTLSVELLEPLSGEAIGHARVEGRAESRDPLPRDQLLDQALAHAARAALQALGVPHAVGQLTPPERGKPLTVLLTKGAWAPVKSLLLLLPAAPEGPASPVAAVAVEKLSGGVAELRLLGRRDGSTGGEVAVWVGRLP